MARPRRISDDIARLQADQPAGEVARFGPDEPLLLDAGIALAPFQIAYRTYGTLNAARSNAILVCHALTGDQHVASPSGDRQARLVGDHDRPRQADRHRSLLRHLLQRARRLHGHDGPGLDRPATGQPYGLSLPLITIPTWSGRRPCW
jgi:homoserine O-acetyltransferase